MKKPYEKMVKEFFPEAYCEDNSNIIWCNTKYRIVHFVNGKKHCLGYGGYDKFNSLLNTSGGKYYAWKDAYKNIIGKLIIDK